MSADIVRRQVTEELCICLGHDRGLQGIEGQGQKSRLGLKFCLKCGRWDLDHGEIHTGSPLMGRQCKWGGLKLATFDGKCAITRKHTR